MMHEYLNTNPEAHSDFESQSNREVLILQPLFPWVQYTFKKDKQEVYILFGVHITDPCCLCRRVSSPAKVMMISPSQIEQLAMEMVMALCPGDRYRCDRVPFAAVLSHTGVERLRPTPAVHRSPCIAQRTQCRESYEYGGIFDRVDERRPKAW